MGSMLKADSERRELVRERRQARIGRKQERRDARERKRRLRSAAPEAASAIQLAAQERVEAELDRIVSEALERHDRDTADASIDRPACAAPATPTIHQRPAGEQQAEPAQPAAGSQTTSVSAGQRVMTEAAPAPWKLSARRGVSATSPRSGSVAGTRRTRRGRRPGSGSRGRANWRPSPTRSPR